MEAHSESQIRARLRFLTNSAGSRGRAISRIAREYGANPGLYYLSMTDDQVVRTTQTNQSVPSQLENEMLNEARQYTF
ncbi:MAG: hypothetical protein AABW63_00480 [Nanoarchaeota archaeon]